MRVLVNASIMLTGSVVIDEEAGTIEVLNHKEFENHVIQTSANDPPLVGQELDNHKTIAGARLVANFQAVLEEKMRQIGFHVVLEPTSQEEKN